MKIVVDAMGSDNYPVPDIEGAVLAAREFPDDTMILVGDQAAIQRELTKYAVQGLKLEIVRATQVVTMEDHPSEVGRQKKDSSMLVGLNLVRDGKADAFVTAGNTGAALALATLYSLRRITGVKRPALTSLIQAPTKTIVLTDLGANTDARPEWMVQFAQMATIYAERILGVAQPKVALLANGEEDIKGNEQVRAAAALLKTMPLNFVGNIEPKDMLKGQADVIVADGFVGNIAIKSMEAIGSTLFKLLEQTIKSNVLYLIGAALMRPALRKVYRQLDPFEIGGAPLLGVNGIVIIGHGRTNAKGIKNAIKQARRAVQGNLIGAIRAQMSNTPNQDD